MPTNEKHQLELDFTPGLTRQFPELLELVAHCVYSSRIGLNGVAAACDKSPSLMSRMLNRNPDDQRHAWLEDLPRIIESTGDLRPIYWQIEKFMEDREAKRKRALDDLSNLMPEIQKMLMEVRNT